MKVMHTHSIPLTYNRKLINKGGSRPGKLYRDVELLHAGDYSDSQTNAPVRYTKEVLHKYHNNWNSSFLNLDHNWETLKRIGWVEDIYFSNDTIKGNIRIKRSTQNGRDTIESIEDGSVNGLSVEIMSEDSWDPVDGIIMANNLEFIGLAVCLHPADPQAHIK